MCLFIEDKLIHGFDFALLVEGKVLQISAFVIVAVLVPPIGQRTTLSHRIESSCEVVVTLFGEFRGSFLQNEAEVISLLRRLCVNLLGCFCIFANKCLVNTPHVGRILLLQFVGKLCVTCELTGHWSIIRALTSETGGRSKM